jgi:HrpA-like RNA helicase
LILNKIIAVKNLKELSALDESEKLTALGGHLARLPLGNVRLGRMLIYASCFQCITPLLAIAALLSTRSPFLSPIDKSVLRVAIVVFIFLTCSHADVMRQAKLGNAFRLDRAIISRC